MRWMPVGGDQRDPVNWILDADIRSFFDSVSQRWLVRFLEHRIGDERVIRLVRKWLKAGVLEEGNWSVSETGTPQGAVVSPLLANVYLHYVFDLWAHQWRRREATGNMIVVRYADDIVVGFEHEADARRFWDAMRTRFEQFSLELHGEKTRLLEFGRYRGGSATAARAGQAGDLHVPGVHVHLRPSLGAERSCSSARPERDRMRAKLREIKEQLRSRMHDAIPEQGRWLQAVVTGFFAYHAVPTNARALAGVPTPRHRSLAAHAAAAEPEGRHDVGADDAALPTRGCHHPDILHPWPERALRRQAPKVGAVCPNRARTDLCGGCPVTGIPTAIANTRGQLGAPAHQPRVDEVARHVGEGGVLVRIGEDGGHAVLARERKVLAGGVRVAQRTRRAAAGSGRPRSRPHRSAWWA